ncbi:restriction endonuclease subunit S [Porphyromonas gingivalis]|nr:restriction endonuclease subunit S [Porphyromonas gingivalis]
MKKYRLKDIATVEISSVDKKAKESEITVRLCNFTDVYYNWAITRGKHDSFMTATANQKEISRFLLKKGQVALTKDSETRFDIGIATYIANDFEDVILGYHCALITPDETKALGCYLNVFLHSEMSRKYFANSASGSGQRYTLSVQTIEDMPILLPPIEEQKRIGELFTNIDRKIEINRAINHNLEAMAKQLYDYWFVQFDFPDENGKPYKSSGGKMVWNDILTREIPEDWNISELNKWLEIKSGFAFKSDTYVSQGTYKVITIKNVQDHHLETTNCDFVNEIPQGLKAWCRLSVNDRLISLTGNCGRLCLVTEENLLLNQRVGLLSCREDILDYAYLLLSSKEFQTLSNNLAMGAAQANLSPVELCKSMAIIPPEKLLEAFNQWIRPIIGKFIQNEIQITTLIKQRDELLPFLMNGQVKVGVERSRLNYDLSNG